MSMRMLLEIMWICSLCVDVKIRRCEDVRVFVARDRQGVLYRRLLKMWKIKTYRYADRLSNTETRRETCLHIYTHRHTQTHTFTHSSFYTQKLLHTEACTHKNFYTQKLLHTKTFIHRSFYTQTLLHTEAFTHRSFCTQKLLYIEAFTHKSFYAQKVFPIHSDTFTHRRFYIHTDAFTHRSFDTQHAFTHKLLHTDAFTHRSFDTQTLFARRSFLHTDTFAHRSFWHRHFYTQKLLTHRHFYTQTLLHTQVITHKHFYTQKLLHTNTFTHRSSSKGAPTALGLCAKSRLQATGSRAQTQAFRKLAVGWRDWWVFGAFQAATWQVCDYHRCQSGSPGCVRPPWGRTQMPEEWEGGGRAIGQRHCRPLRLSCREGPQDVWWWGDPWSRQSPDSGSRYGVHREVPDQTSSDWLYFAQCRMAFQVFWNHDLADRRKMLLRRPRLRWWNWWRRRRWTFSPVGSWAEWHWSGGSAIWSSSRLPRHLVGWKLITDWIIGVPLCLCPWNVGPRSTCQCCSDGLLSTWPALCRAFGLHAS